MTTRFSTALAALVLLVAGGAFATTVSGTVTSSAGALVSGVTVDARNAGTTTSVATATTRSRRVYALPGTTGGTYDYLSPPPAGSGLSSASLKSITESAATSTHNSTLPVLTSTNAVLSGTLSTSLGDPAGP